MTRAWFLAGAFFALGCGSPTGESGPDATSDGTTGDIGIGDDAKGPTEGGGVTGDAGGPDSDVVAEGGGAPDGSSADGADGAGGSDGAGDHDSGAMGSDSSIADAGVSDVIAADGACKCQPYWCGCGACSPGQIACTVDPPVCARGCASSCPELQQVACSCDQGRCVRGGIDAAAIGCLQDEDCPPGNCCAHISANSFCATAPNQCCVGGIACP
jgi:hypothetical protein